MSRSQPSRNFSIPSLILIVIVVGYRFWQQQQHTQKPGRTGQTTHSSRSKKSSHSSSSSAPSKPSLSSGQGSSEGNMLLGNPSDAGTDPDNYLLERDQYSMSFNHSNGGPNWVSWHTDGSNLGSVDRGKFAPDPNLPADWQIRPNDYKGSGYDRGHMCPSADRTNSREDNNATFYMSNMVPQTAPLNEHIWADLEKYLRDQIRDGNEIYEIAGGLGSAGQIGGGKINVPQSCWKVAVIIPEGTGDLGRITAKSRIIAVDIPNTNDDSLNTADWRTYMTTAGKIQSATKLNLLSALPADVQKALKNTTDSGN